MWGLRCNTPQPRATFFFSCLTSLTCSQLWKAGVAQTAYAEEWKGYWPSPGPSVSDLRFRACQAALGHLHCEILPSLRGETAAGTGQDGVSWSQCYHLGMTGQKWNNNILVNTEGMVDPDCTRDGNIGCSALYRFCWQRPHNLQSRKMHF